MRWIKLLVAFLASGLFLIGLSVPAQAIRDPIIVCVREPCGPQLPELPPLPDVP